MGVANIYAEPAFNSAVTTQCILGESLRILDSDDEWVKVKQWDEYEGWIHLFYLVEKPDDWATDFEYRRTVGWVYTEPSLEAETCRQISTGVRLPSINKDNAWTGVLLPDGVTGYVNNQTDLPDGSNVRENILKTAELYLGTSYLWGGTTGYGFDCSGFVQTVFRLNGMNVPRDAYMQAEQGAALKNRDEIRPGDLLFFTEKDKVSHVAIAYNTDEFIHCSAFVRRNSLHPEDQHYSKRLHGYYTGANQMIED
mgnify:CR=1 FL=1